MLNNDQELSMQIIRSFYTRTKENAILFPPLPPPSFIKQFS